MLKWTEAQQDAYKRSIYFLLRQPWSSLMTIVMMAVTMMLAVLCWIATYHISKLNENWHRNESMTLYLRQPLATPEQQALLQKISAMPTVASANLISPIEGLELLAKQDGMKDMLSSLPYNPLPAVIQVMPSSKLNTPAAVKALYHDLQTEPNVADIQFDSDWIERLYTRLGFIKQLVRFLTVLFVLSITLVIGNTLRLLIYNRQADIQVLQLLGAPAAFIRRPFLYTSMWYGFLSAILAIVFADIVLILLRNGLNQWATSYQFPLTFSLLPALWILGLISISIALSWTGARLTLKYYL